MITSLCAQPLEELRGVKLTNVDSDLLFSDRSIADGMDYLASIGVNMVLTVVWNSSGADGDYTLYPSDVMSDYFDVPIHPAFNNRDPLKRVIIEAHRNGIEVLPWFEMGFSTSYSQDGGHILDRYPDWALEDINGNLVVKNGFDWMSAINPDVQEFILALTVEVAKKYDIDGIEYSDRIPALPVEGGYDKGTIDVYKAEHGGNTPPVNYTDTNWMRWRAGKLSQFFSNVRDSIKAIDQNLFVASSPSLYPWSYDNYLQDSKTWVETGIADHIIPQVYRYNLTDYTFELNKSLANFPDDHSIYFPGMLVKVGDYLITPDDLMNEIQLNRQKGLNGEVFFFYEGLRDNGNLLGETLRSTFYSEEALVPGRNLNEWRPKATIVNEDGSQVITHGSWKESTIDGFTNGILINDDIDFSSIDYYCNVPFSSWFDIYAYCVPGPLAADSAAFTIFSESDSSRVFLDQTNLYNAGWQFLKSAYLMEGNKKIVTLDNSRLAPGQKLTADAVMVMINRKKSPDVLVSPIESQSKRKPELPSTIVLNQNFPNPFNPKTVITYTIGSGQPKLPTHVDLSIYNLLGQKIVTLVSEKQVPGNFKVEWDASEFASGVYLYQLTTGRGYRQTKKLVLLK